MTRKDEIPAEIAVGVGQELLKNYFQLFTETRPAVIRFYAPDAELTWNGVCHRGIHELQNFIQRELPQLTFQAMSYVVHRVVGTDNLMVIVTGSMAGQGRVADFHSTFFVEWSPKTKKVLIKYHTHFCE